MGSGLFWFVAGAIFVLAASAMLLCKISPTKTKPIYCGASYLASLLVLCTWWSQIQRHAIEAASAYLSCLFFAFLTKLTISRIVLGRATGWKCLPSDFYADLPLLIISPDYIAAKLCKEMCWETKGALRKRIIQCFNYCNLLFSFLLCFVFSLLCFLFPNSSCMRFTFLSFLAVRAVSRSTEIVVSFVGDVVQGKRRRRSTLNGRDRITLAFLSVLEMVVLTFGVTFCSDAIGYDSLSRAVLQALSVMTNVPNFGNGASGKVIAALFCGLACFALIGVVIGAYLGDPADDCVRVLETNPQLYVMKGGEVRNVIPFTEIDGLGVYVLNIRNEAGCSYYVREEGYVHLEDPSRFDGVKATENTDNFELMGEEFEIRYDSSTQDIKITKKEMQR